MNSDAPPGKKATLGWPFSFALNRLLEAEPWARARLASFAGDTVEVRSPPLPALRFVILPGGRLEAGGADPALTVTVRPEALFSLARGPEHFARALEVTGDPRLASEVLTLAQHLRWDVEEDQSKVFGDVLAHRMAEAGRAFAGGPAAAARRPVDALLDYAVDEPRVLRARQAVAGFAEAVARLRDAVERLEKRVRRLA